MRDGDRIVKRIVRAVVGMTEHEILAEGDDLLRSKIILHDHAVTGILADHEFIEVLAVGAAALHPGQQKFSARDTVDRKIFLRDDVGRQRLSRADQRRIDIFIIFHDKSSLIFLCQFPYRRRSAKAFALENLTLSISSSTQAVTSALAQMTSAFV